jgi:mRNA interferase RelE/StbE
MYTLLFTDVARANLKKLDHSIARQILSKLNWLAENFDALQPEALTAEWSGTYKLRAGDYRVLYSVYHDKNHILIHLIGHRRDVYNR